MFQPFLQGLIFGIIAGLLFACGETVNYETREKLVASVDLGQSTSTAADATAAPSTPQTAALSCDSPAVQHQNVVLNFPEIPQGTTCTFGAGENLSRKDGFIRAYLRQNQDVSLPAGAHLCGFSIAPTQGAMRYDDEMFFLVDERVLIATKDYTEYFPKDGLLSTFKWEALRNKVYNQFDQRGLYCVGGAEGLSECQLPPTETSGSIEMSISAELSSTLATVLQERNVLHFSWVTTGDNDDSDCRHTAINLPLTLHYLPADAATP